MDVLTSEHLQRMANSALAALEREKRRINGLNVFPVPDGDTGTNMALTLKAAVKGMSGATIHQQAKALAHGALWGARGNSGTILSQFFHGFYVGLQECEHADAHDIARAFQSAAQTAYSAVTEPQEGTMLTVGRAAAEGAVQAADAGLDVDGVLEAALQAAVEALERTPQLLPILQEAGVVDAGGEGLVVCAAAALEALRNEGTVADFSHSSNLSEDVGSVEAFDVHSIDPHSRFAIHEADITFQYCTEFLVSGTAIDLESLRSTLSPLGDSLMVVGSSELVKVHVHTDHPGKALEEGCRWGDLMDVSVGNMKRQNEDSLRGQRQEAEVAIVAVGWGAGFSEIMASYGVAEIIPATSALKPSAGQFLEAIERAPATRVIVLPAHKDAALAAQQGADMSSKEVAVVPAYTAPGAISALLQFDAQADFQESVRAMTAGAEGMRVAQVTQAARDASLQGVDVEAGDFITMVDGELTCASKGLLEAVRTALASMGLDDGALVTLYFGERIQPETADEHCRTLQEEFAGCEFEVYAGGQSTFDYWIAVE